MVDAIKRLEDGVLRYKLKDRHKHTVTQSATLLAAFRLCRSDEYG